MPMADQQPRWLELLAHPECTLPPLRIWNSLTRSETAFIPVDSEGEKSLGILAGRRSMAMLIWAMPGIMLQLIYSVALCGITSSSMSNLS